MIPSFAPLCWESEMLKIDNVTVKIAGIAVLRGIRTEFKAGNLVAVVGRNGAGKTTLLRAIMGLLPLTEGAIQLNDVNLVSQPDYRRAREGIGYAPEDRVMFPTLTVEENLRLPCQILGMGRSDVDARLEQTLVVVPQLADLLRRSGSALSGGQGKMAALGRALMVGTKMVLLDEPFQGLAPVLANQYAESLRRVRDFAPNSCVVVTESNRSLLKDLPDETVILERGELQSPEVEHAIA